jgi:hypothetical protein
MHAFLCPPTPLASNPANLAGRHPWEPPNRPDATAGRWAPIRQSTVARGQPTRAHSHCDTPLHRSQGGGIDFPCQRALSTPARPVAKFSSSSKPRLVKRRKRLFGACPPPPQDRSLAIDRSHMPCKEDKAQKAALAASPASIRVTSIRRHSLDNSHVTPPPSVALEHHRLPPRLLPLLPRLNLASNLTGLVCHRPRSPIS